MAIKNYEYPKGTKCIVTRFIKRKNRWQAVEQGRGTMPTKTPKLKLGSVQTLRRNGELEITDCELGTKVRYTPLNKKK